MQATDATVEWSVLQNQYDSYEKFSLVIKLTSVLVVAILLGLELPMLACVLVAVLWFQDAIWKTFQSRMGTRLLRLEAFFADEQAQVSAEEKPFQLNRQFEAKRPGTLGLCREYLSQAVRPTVAFPHAVLFLVCLV